MEKIKTAWKWGLDFFKDGPAISNPLRSRSNRSNLPVLQEPFPGRQLGSIMSHWSSLAINWSPPGHIFIPQRTWLASCGSAMNYKTRLQWKLRAIFQLNAECKFVIAMVLLKYTKHFVIGLENSHTACTNQIQNSQSLVSITRRL